MAYNELIESAVACLSASAQPALALTSGGNSPKIFMPQIFAACSAQNLEVTWSLSDERCVPHEHPASNFGMIRQMPESPQHHLMPIYNPEGAAYTGEDYFQAYPLAILGFAIDGHTLSIFPNSWYLSAATDPMHRDMMFTGHQLPGEAFTRVSFGFAFLARFDNIFLIVSEPKKQDFLNRAWAQNAEALPVTALIKKFKTRIRLFAPDGELHL